MARRESTHRARHPDPGRDTVRNIEISARPTFSKSGRFTGYHGVGSDVTEARRAADRIAHMARHDALTGLPNRSAGARKSRGRARHREEPRRGMRGPPGRPRPLQDDQRFPRPRRRRPSSAAGVQLLRDGDLRRDDRRTASAATNSRSSCRRSSAAASSSNCAWPWSARCRGRSSIATRGCSSAPASAWRSGRATAKRRGDDPQRRPRSVSGQGRQRQRHPLLRTWPPCPRRRAPPYRAGPPRRGRQAANSPSTTSRSSTLETLEIKSFEALLRWHNPELGQHLAVQVHPDRRGDRHARPDRRMGAARPPAARRRNWPERHLARGQRLATPAARSRLHRHPGVGAHPGRPRAAPARARSHRDRVPRADRGHARRRLTSSRAWASARARRFRHRLFLARLSAHVPFDKLKIDRSFVQAISADDAESTAIIRAVVALAGSLGMKTVPKAWRPKSSSSLVRTLGCDRIQGFIFSKPVIGRDREVDARREPQPRRRLDLSPSGERKSLAQRRGEGVPEPIGFPDTPDPLARPSLHPQLAGGFALALLWGPAAKDRPLWLLGV